jgi:hypothetical protein
MKSMLDLGGAWCYCATLTPLFCSWLQSLLECGSLHKTSDNAMTPPAPKINVEALLTRALDTTQRSVGDKSLLC